MNIERLDDEGRWWRIGSYEVDTRVDEATYPGNVRACALAHRDATDDESHDVAAILAVDVEMGEQRPLPITAGWLFAQAQKIHVRIWAHIHQLEEKHREHAA